MSPAAPQLSRRSLLRWPRSLLVSVAAIVAVLPALPASAHTSLMSSYPGTNSTVTSPDEVRLTFSEEIQSGPGSAVSISGPDGAIAAAVPTIAGREVVARPTRDLLPAQYSVAYRVIARDGHPITGRYAFTVGSPSPALPAALSGGLIAPAPAPAAAAAASSESSGTPTTLYVVLGLLALVAAAGFARLIRQTRAGSQ